MWRVAGWCLYVYIRVLWIYVDRVWAHTTVFTLLHHLMHDPQYINILPNDEHDQRVRAVNAGARAIGREFLCGARRRRSSGAAVRVRHRRGRRGPDGVEPGQAFVVFPQANVPPQTPPPQPILAFSYLLTRRASSAAPSNRSPKI